MKLFKNFKPRFPVGLFPAFDFLSRSPATDAEIGIGVHFANGNAGGFDFDQEDLQSSDVTPDREIGGRELKFNEKTDDNSSLRL